MHVPVVQSDSYRRYLGERLTEAIVKQIELKTPYKVVGSDAADSVLSMRLVSESKRVLPKKRFDEPRDIETDFFVQVSWVDRRGDLMMTQDNVPAAPLLLNIGQTANFVPEAGQSLATAAAGGDRAAGGAGRGPDGAGMVVIGHLVSCLELGRAGISFLGWHFGEGRLL